VNIVKLTFLRIVFLMLPAQILLAWLLRFARSELVARGFHIYPFVYSVIVVIVIYIPAWLTVQPFVTAMRRRKLEAQTNVSD